MTVLSRHLFISTLALALAACEDDSLPSPFDAAVPDARLPDAAFDAGADDMMVEIPDAEPPRPDARPDLRCEEACATLAACAASSDRCPGVGAEDEASYAEICVPACEVNASLLDLVDGSACDDTVSRIRALSDDFDTRCQSTYTLTVLHTAGGVSDLLPQQAELAGGGDALVGGGARAAALMRQLRASAGTDGVVAIHTGDHLIPGWAYDVTQDLPLSAMGPVLQGATVDVAALGEQDFFIGPEHLAAWITAWGDSPTVVASNLGDSESEALQALRDTGVISTRVVVEAGGARIGIISALPGDLPEIASPLSNVLDPLAALILEVLALQEEGVDKIVMVSHLDRFEEDRILSLQAIGVDAVIAAGGGVYLGDMEDQRLVGDTLDPVLTYPTMVVDGAGGALPVVAVPGGFRYVGRLGLTFNDQGDVIAIDETSGPVGVWADERVPVDQGTLDALQTSVEQPLQMALEAPGPILATTSVEISGVNSTMQEVNAGDLVADAMLWQARASAAAYGADPAVPIVALVDGGSIQPVAWPVAEDALTLDLVYDLVPEQATVVLVELSRTQLKTVLEHSFSEPMGMAAEYFPQVAGMRLMRALGEEARGTDENGAGIPGSRVRDVQIEGPVDGGARLVSEGRVQSPSDGQSATVYLATTNRLVAGLWDYPFNLFPAAARIPVGETVQGALRAYIVDALEGEIGLDDYPTKGQDRILDVNP
ncbi:MAG: 5'-nucleotidase C-terminal domain-containing protein [Bradymonadia bacterium]